MAYSHKLYYHIEKQLKQLQAEGYIIPENSDFEVGTAINVTARNITEKAEELLHAKEYVLIGGKFYSKAAIKDKVAPKEIQ